MCRIPNNVLLRTNGAIQIQTQRNTGRWGRSAGVARPNLVAERESRMFAEDGRVLHRAQFYTVCRK